MHAWVMFANKLNTNKCYVSCGSISLSNRILGNLFEEHCVIAAFEAEGPNQISAESGDQVLVLAKDKSGKNNTASECNILFYMFITLN